MPGQVTALYCIVMHSTQHSTAEHWLYWVIRGRSLDNKDNGARGGRGEGSNRSASVWRAKEKI